MSLLEVTDLTVENISQTKPLLKDISFKLEEGEILGILGESGSGKTLTALSILRLLPPGLKVTKGQIFFQGKDLLSLRDEEMHLIRGKEISIIVQDPLSSLNPVLTVGSQIEEVVNYHLGIKGREARSLIINILKEVGIPDPEIRLKSYPFELSGGLRQRFMIAMAIICNPKLLIADEPTTALDLTIQMQVLSLLKKLNQERGLSILFITHDLGIMRWLAKRILVFYQGEILEMGSREVLFKNPLHPYTKLLFDSYPGRGKGELTWSHEKRDGEESFCSFYGRCERACREALLQRPPLIEVEKGHWVRCFLYA